MNRLVSSWLRLWRRRSMRGGSMSIFVVLMVPAVILIAGLVVDGGRQLMATQRAEGAADGAARAGLDAAATARLGGGSDTTSAVLAARHHLAASGVTGDVRLVAGGRLHVTAHATEDTLYLALIGISTVDADAESTVTLTRTRG